MNRKKEEEQLFLTQACVEDVLEDMRVNLNLKLLCDLQTEKENGFDGQMLWVEELNIGEIAYYHSKERKLFWRMIAAIRRLFRQFMSQLFSITKTQ